MVQKPKVYHHSCYSAWTLRASALADNLSFSILIKKLLWTFIFNEIIFPLAHYQWEDFSCFIFLKHLPLKRNFVSWQIRHLWLSCCSRNALSEFQNPGGSHWVNWHMWHIEQPQMCTKVQGWDKSQMKKVFHLKPFIHQINWSVLTEGSSSRFCYRSRPECGTFGSSSHTEC